MLIVKNLCQYVLAENVTSYECLTFYLTVEI